MNCPFCGVLTDVPHETQGACITALHAEIGRVRRLLHQDHPQDAVADVARADSEPEAFPRPA